MNEARNITIRTSARYERHHNTSKIINICKTNTTHKIELQVYDLTTTFRTLWKWIPRSLKEFVSTDTDHKRRIAFKKGFKISGYLEPYLCRDTFYGPRGKPCERYQIVVTQPKFFCNALIIARKLQELDEIEEVLIVKDWV